jgi:hypothetical protein
VAFSGHDPNDGIGASWIAAMACGMHLERLTNPTGAKDAKKCNEFTYLLLGVLGGLLVLLGASSNI